MHVGLEPIVIVPCSIETHLPIILPMKYLHVADARLGNLQSERVSFYDQQEAPKSSYHPSSRRSAQVALGDIHFIEGHSSTFIAAEQNQLTFSDLAKIGVIIILTEQLHG